MKKFLIIALMMVSCVSISKAQFIDMVSSDYITFVGGFKVATEAVPYGGYLGRGKDIISAIFEARRVRRAYWGNDYIGYVQEMAFEMSKLSSLKRLLAEAKGVKDTVKVSKAQKKADAKKAAEDYAKRRAAAASNGTGTSKVTTVKVDSNGVHAVSDGSEYDFSF